MQQDDARTRALAIGAGALAIIALGVAGIVGIAYSGAYNVAATEEHTAFVRWALDTNFHNSVEGRAAGLTPPGGLDADAGGAPYKAMCQHCHGGPGAEPSEWSRGMRPQPPHLTEAADEWELAEVFWLAKHGVRMTGMPAFGPTHEDRALWEIAAFVKALPGLTPERYAAIDGGGDGHHTEPSGDGSPTGATPAKGGG